MWINLKSIENKGFLMWITMWINFYKTLYKRFNISLNSLVYRTNIISHFALDFTQKNGI